MAFVLFVFNTVSLKHTQNQIFNLSCGTRLSFIALFFAALSRSFLALFAYSFYIIIPALLVLFVFVYFIYKFFPIYENNGFQGEWIKLAFKTKDEFTANASCNFYNKM